MRKRKILSERDELVLAEPMAGRYFSADMGGNWEQMDCPWQEVVPGGYISDVSLSPEGAVAMVYSPYNEEEDSDSSEMVWKAVRRQG